jgi:Kelch motif
MKRVILVLLLVATATPAVVARFVFVAGSPQSAAVGAPPGEVVAARFATLPEATSSFGAVAADGWLYVYGGHVVPTHSYSIDAVSGRFSRLNLADGTTWESLPGGPPLQGASLVSHRGRIYRIGGMQPQNKPGEPEDVHSVADVARFDPATRRWDALPPLPAPRSSHDAVVVGDTLIVMGGWALHGKGRTEWPDSMDVLDLAAPMPEWQRIPQPFKRRALIAAALDRNVYVLGGFNEKSQVVHGVSTYNVASRAWSSGPDLPGGAMNGFGPAACVLDGRLYVSVDDGGLFRLDAAWGSWEKVGRATPRIVHRLVPASRQVLVVGGAHGGANSDLIEAVTVRP